MNRKLQIAVLLNALSVLLLGVGLALGTVAFKARMTPQKKEAITVPMPGPVVIVGDTVYNLAEPDRYLKATIVLEVEDLDEDEEAVKAVLSEIQQRTPKIKDIIIHAINAKTYRDLNSPEGKLRLKTDLKEKINRVLGHGELRRVMFSSFAIQ